MVTSPPNCPATGRSDRPEDHPAMNQKIKTYLKRLGFLGFMFFFLKGLGWLAVFYFGLKIFE